MSYRNPRIIDDKSGLIVSQAIEKASGTLAQGIAVFGAEEKRREEVLKKENERRNDIYIGLANQLSVDATEFNAKLKEGPENLRNIMIPNTQSLLEQINYIDIDQKINGNKDPMLSKRRADLVQRLTDANTFAESYITTASNARQLYGNDPNAFQTGKYTFREFDGTASNAQASTIFNAIGGIPNYSIDFSKGEDNKFNVTVKGDGQSFTMTQEDFLNKSNNLVIKKETNAAVVQSELLNTQLYNADGGASARVRDGKSSVKTYRDGNLEYTVNRQMLNTAEVNAVNLKSQLEMASYIDSFIDKQEQALYLEDLNIDPKEYQGNPDKRNDLIKTAQIGLFKADSGVKERIIKGGEGEDDLIEYYIDTPIGNPTKITTSAPSDKQDDAAYWKNNTTNLFNTTRTTAEIMPEVLPVQIGSSFQGGKITKLEWGADSVTVSFSGPSDADVDPDAPATSYTAGQAPSIPGSVTLRYDSVKQMTTLAESVGGSLKNPRAASVLALQIANNNSKK